MRPLLSYLADGKAHTLSDLYGQICKDFKMTEAEINQRTNSGRQTIIRNRVGWARTYLHKANLMTIPNRGEAQITERGQQALKECPSRIDVKFLKRYPEFLEFITPKQTSSADTESVAEESTPEEQLDAAYKAITGALTDELLNTIKSGTPSFFEDLVVDLMLAMGYGGSREDAGAATQATNDDGIDGTIKEDRLGLDTIYLQAKRWQNTVQRPEIDKFIGSLTRNRARKGVFITTSDFSSGARDAVQTLDMKVVLIDGKQLAELMIEHNLGVTCEKIYEVKKLNNGFFNEDN